MDYVKELDNKGLLKRNFDHPPLKDSVTVPVGGYTIIRFIANNPGTWLLHCHLEFHSGIGMMVMFKVGKSTDIKQIPTGFPKCGNYKYKSLKINSATNIKIKLISITLIFLPILHLLLFI
jgi:L-ascorbate oxidase